ncbi:MAG: heme A synthase [Bacteroidetes bacterium]|nr:heme A synthase [Bacteroidota bacterium]
MMTLFLIFVGALVKSHDAGLSVPDWPNTYGQFMYAFPIDLWRANIFYEHSHRLLASFVGFLILVQAFMLWRLESRSWVKRLGWLALAAVIAQGILGGLTVIFLLPTWISTSHASLAQTTLCIATAIALVTSRKWDDDTVKVQESGSSLRTLSKYTVAAIFLQLVFGAVMRHEEAGLAIATWPLANGSLIPHFSDLGVVLNFIHRTWAWVVAVLIFTTAIKSLRAYRTERSFRTPAIFSMLLVLVQITLGAITIWSGKEPNWTSLHVMNGAAVLMTEVILAIRIHHRLRMAASDRIAAGAVTSPSIVS